MANCIGAKCWHFFGPQNPLAIWSLKISQNTLLINIIFLALGILENTISRLTMKQVLKRNSEMNRCKETKEQFVSSML